MAGKLAAGAPVALCFALGWGGPNDHFRVNQLGYLKDDIKIGIIGSKAGSNPAGKKFHVVKAGDGTVVHEGTVGASRGTKDTPFTGVFPCDFTAVKQEGEYKLKLEDGTASHPFAVGAAKEYGDALAMVLEFFRSQRCGPYDPVLHKACHLNDANAAINATGGWHDAGDYIKFMVTITWAAYNLVQAADYAQAYGMAAVLRDAGPANGKTDILEEVKVGLDHIMRMSRDRKYYRQVSGREDHSHWRMPETDDLPPYRVGNPRRLHEGWGGNLLGRAVASLAVAARLFKQENPAYADSCLKHAEALFADRKSWEKGSGSIDFYGESSWREDMALGAAELHKTTGSADAKAYAAEMINGVSSTEMGWVDASWHAYAALFRAGIETSAMQAKMKADLESLNGKSKAEAFFLSSGYGWGTTAMFTANAHKALLYYYLTQDKAYLEQAAAQRDYHLGRNNWGVTFTQGLGEVYPEHSHSQLNDLAGLHRGAAVGGPSTSPVGGGTDRFAEFQSTVKYFDRQADYVTNEVAIDYAVHTVFMFMHYAAQASGAVSVRDSRGITLAPVPAWFLAWSPRSGALRLPAALSGPALLRVVDMRGATLRAFPLPAGARGLAWDGRDASGRPLAPGVYPLLMTGGTSAAGKLILE